MKQAEAAIEKFEKTGNLYLIEPCDCGSQIRHNNGGNYHRVTELLRHSDGRVLVRESDTCELVAVLQWKNCPVTNDPHKIIRQRIDAGWEL